MAVVAHICCDDDGGCPCAVQCNLRSLGGLGGGWRVSCSSAREVGLDLFLGVCLDMICFPLSTRPWVLCELTESKKLPAESILSGSFPDPILVSPNVALTYY